jgi:hypothetical protein
MASLFVSLRLILAKSPPTSCEFLERFAQSTEMPAFFELLCTAVETGNISLETVFRSTKTLGSMAAALSFLGHLTPLLKSEAEITEAFTRVATTHNIPLVQFINSFTGQIETGKKGLAAAIIRHSPSILRKWVCAAELTTRHALEKLVSATVPRTFVPPAFHASPTASRGEAVAEAKESLKRWDDFIDGEVAPSNRVGALPEEKYEFVSAIRCWHYLAANAGGLSPERAELVVRIIERFRTCRYVDQHVIALVSFFFAFPRDIVQENINAVFESAVLALDVAEPGFSSQLDAFLAPLNMQDKCGFSGSSPRRHKTRSVI